MGSRLFLQMEVNAALTLTCQGIKKIDFAAERMKSRRLQQLMIWDETCMNKELARTESLWQEEKQQEGLEVLFTFHVYIFLVIFRGAGRAF